MPALTTKGKSNLNLVFFSELLNELGISAPTARKYIAEGLLPKPMKLFGRKRAWRREVLVRHFERLERQAAREAP